MGVLNWGLAMLLAMPAIDVPLRFVEPELGPAAPVYLPQSQAPIKLLSQPTTIGGRLPYLTGAKAIYATLTLGDRQVPLAFVSKGRGAKTYDTLFFDTDGDGQLEGETPIRPATLLGSENAPQAFFTVRDIKVHTGGTLVRYSLRLTIVPSEVDRQGGRTFSCIGAAGYYRGDFTVDGKTYHIALGDANVNGRFTDKLKIAQRSLEEGSRFQEQGDSLSIVSDEAPDHFSDRTYFGDYLVVGNQTFAVSVAPDCTKMTLSPISEDLTPIRMGTDFVRMQLWDGIKSRSLVMYKPSGEFLVPKGTYRLVNCEAWRSEPEGARWRLLARGTWESRTMNARGETATPVPWGEPYRPMVTLAASGRRSAGSTNQLHFELQGTGNEIVNYLRRESNAGTRLAMSTTRGREGYPKEPTYRIVTADGEVVDSGTFEYG